MSRQLIIMRHAKSSWAEGNTADVHRELNARGLRDAPRMGYWLATSQLTPDYLLASTARRARHTLALVSAELGAEPVSLNFDARIYEATLKDLLKVLADCPQDAKRVLLVGHNPGLSYLAEFLCADLPPAPNGNLMPTCTALAMAMPDDWTNLSRACAQLLHLQRPRELS